MSADPSLGQNPKTFSKKTQDMQQIMSDLRTLTDKDFYSVRGGKKNIGVKAARILARQYSIKTGIVDYGKDKEKAWCHIRAWRGNEQVTSEVAEACVVIRFIDVYQQIVLSAIANGVWAPVDGSRNKGGRFDGQLMQKQYEPEWEPNAETGFPVIKDKWVKFKIAEQYNAKVNILERDAYGKAERNAICEILLVDEKDSRTDGKPQDEAKPEQKPLQKPEEPKGDQGPSADSSAKATIKRMIDILMEAHGNKILAQEHFIKAAKECGLNYKSTTDIKTNEEAENILNHVLAVSGKAIEVEEEDGDND